MGNTFKHFLLFQEIHTPYQSTGVQVDTGPKQS